MKVLNLLTVGKIGGIEVLMKNIGIHNKSENGFCFLFDGGAIYEEMKRLGLKVYCLGEDEKKKISIKKFFKLRNIAKEYDIIVVHHGDVYLKMYHYLLILTLRKKYVVYTHSCWEMPYTSLFKNILFKLMFQLDFSLTDLIIFVSYAGLESHEKSFYLKNKKLQVVYNGIGMDILEEGKVAFHVPKEPFNILYIGRLEDEKGLPLLLEALKKIRYTYPVKLSIVGDGSQVKYLKNLEHELHLEDITTFHGEQKNIIPFLRRADIFVYPSVCEEVFGISLVEAMAFGLLTISNKVGGIPEIIEDGKNGFLCEEKSSEALAHKIEEVIAKIKSGDSRAISETAKDRAKEFSIHKTVTNLHKVYRTLLQSEEGKQNVTI